MLARFRALFLRLASAYVRRERDNVLDNYIVPRRPADLRFSVVTRPHGLEREQRPESAPGSTGATSDQDPWLRSIMIPPPAA